MSANKKQKTALRRVRCAINGFGRVGRIVTRCAFDSEALEIVHINEPAADAATNAYLLQYDSAHGVWPHECSGEGKEMLLGGRKVSYSQERDPAAIDWTDTLLCAHA